MKVHSLLPLFLTVMLLNSCGSNPLSAGSPLPGIGLVASKQVVLLSWSKDGVLAKGLRNRTRISLLASYDTEFGPVKNEEISYGLVKSSFPGLKFPLPDRLKFTPEGPVCLRLAIGRKAIPLRIPEPGESSNEFLYKEWSNNARLESHKSNYETRLKNVSGNIENFSKPDENFQRWKQNNNLTSVEQCKNIAVSTTILKPTTALLGESKAEAAKQQCVELYNKNLTENGAPAIFFDMNELVKAAQADSIYLSKAKKMQLDFDRYNPGKIYFPGSDFPLDSSAIKVLMVDRGVSTIEAKILIEAYDACILEAETRFTASYNNWKKVTSQKTIAARQQPLQDMCKARFDLDADRLNELAVLEQVKLDVESEYNDFLNNKLNQKVALPKQKKLVPHSCSEF